MKRLVLVLALVGVFSGNAAQADDARKILEAAGINGGLLVHVGCGDGKLTAALRLSDSFIVQGLDADVTKARENIRTANVYGPAKLRWVAAANGQTLGELDLDSSPVWDGLAVAKGRVYLTTSDGEVHCFAGGSK